MGWLRRDPCVKSGDRQTSLPIPVRRTPIYTRNERIEPKATMSCRIDRVVTAENLVVLFISGRITGEHVDMLRGVLEQESGSFTIDLKNVLLVDREAVKLLALSEADEAQLRRWPPLYPSMGREGEGGNA